MIYDSAQPSAECLIERNQAKQLVSADSLRDNQERVVQTLRQQATNGGIINLCGSEGSGKTFLAWYLARQSDEWEYQPWLPTPAPISAPYLIVDNVAATRVASRRIREIITFDDATCVVAITRDQLPEASATVSL